MPSETERLGGLEPAYLCIAVGGSLCLVFVVIGLWLRWRERSGWRGEE